MTRKSVIRNFGEDETCIFFKLEKFSQSSKYSEKGRGEKSEIGGNASLTLGDGCPWL